MARMFFAGALICLTLLPGCSTSQLNDHFASASDSITTGSLAAKQQGLVVFGIGTAGNDAPYCEGTLVTLATGPAGAYKFARSVPVKNIFKDTELAQLSLTAGTYQIVEIQCFVHNGKYLLRAPSYKKDVLSPALYSKSLAEFTVNVGEITNIGFLRIHTDNQRTGVARVFLGPSYGTPQRVIEPIPDADLARMKTNKPNLFAKMVTRPMISKP